MKKIFLAMVALLSMTAMMAQDNNNGERKAPKQLTPEEMTEKMATDLSLTAEQKAKVLVLQKEYQDINRGPRMGGMRGPRPQVDGQGQRPERPQLTEEQRAEMQKQMERRREYNDKLKGILTAEQFEKYQKQFRHGHRPGGFGRGPRPGGPRPE